MRTVLDSSPPVARTTYPCRTVTAVTPSDSTRSVRTARYERAEVALPTRDYSVLPTLSGSARRSVGWYLLLVSPGVWVVAVLGIGFALHIGVELLPLLAAAPAIACAGTGRKICVTL